MEFSAIQVCSMLGGKLEGEGTVLVNKLSKIEEGVPGSLTFLANPKYTSYIYSTGASVVVVNNDFVADKAIRATLIRVPNAYESFAQLLDIYKNLQLNKKGIDSLSFVDPSVALPDDVYVGAFAFIGKNVKVGKGVKIYPQVYLSDNVEVGEGTTLYSGVKIYPDCVVGKYCTLHSGVIIGADGFGFAPQQGTEFKKVAQIGNVIIGNHVEIGSNSTIDRATLGSTIIHDGVKLDNLIQIAHNVEIGENTVIAAQTGVAGSTKIGKNCMIGGQVGILGHIVIEDNVKIAAKSGVGHNTKSGSVLMGGPSFDASDYKRAYVIFRKLPELEKRIAELEHALAAKNVR